MLVLTRKLMEKVYIGDQICVTVVRLEGGQVRLGIDAPRTIPVVRAELQTRQVEPAESTMTPAEPPVMEPKRVPLGTGIRPRAPFR